MDRRRLLRGTLSAPLVMTVTPALATARTTFMACLEGGSKPVGAVAPLSSVSADEWLRVDLEIFEVRLPNAKGEFVAQSGRFFVGPDNVSLYRLADARPDSEPATLVNQFNSQSFNMQKRVVEKRRALAYVNRDGRVVGYAWEPRGGSQITASCYASINGMLGADRAA